MMAIVKSRKPAQYGAFNMDSIFDGFLSSRSCAATAQWSSGEGVLRGEIALPGVDPKSVIVGFRGRRVEVGWTDRDGAVKRESYDCQVPVLGVTATVSRGLLTLNIATTESADADLVPVEVEIE